MVFNFVYFSNCVLVQVPVGAESGLLPAVATVDSIWFDLGLSSDTTGDSPPDHSTSSDWSLVESGKSFCFIYTFVCLMIREANIIVVECSTPTALRLNIITPFY